MRSCDSTITSSQVGCWLLQTIDRVKSVVSTSKRVVITESNWSSKGLANGLAVSGLCNQKMALKSIQRAFVDTSGDKIFFSAFMTFVRPKLRQHLMLTDFGELRRCCQMQLVNGYKDPPIILKFSTRPNRQSQLNRTFSLVSYTRCECVAHVYVLHHWARPKK